jgi:hypothetical protein
MRRRGVIDRILLAIDALPGPVGLAWAAVAVGLAAAAHVIVWLTGGRPIGELYPDIAAAPVIFAWFGFLLQVLNRVATSVFDEFRPALGNPDAEAHYRLELTSVPDRYAIVAGALTVATLQLLFWAYVRPTLPASVTPSIDIVATVLWSLVAFVVGVTLLHTVRQLRAVSRLSAVARNVDIFRPRPLNALARLTSVASMGIIAFVVAYTILNPAQPLAFLVQGLALLGVAVALFVLPLRVMHARLADEKQSLLSANQDRLKAVLTRIHAVVDERDLEHSEQLNHTLTAVLAERNVLAKLQTWPWSEGTFRGFASALLLPIFLIIVSQLVGRLF